jgi:hypothetical protein
MTGPSKTAKIDPRGPRFGAGITAVMLLVVVVLGLHAAPTAGVIDTSWWLLLFTFVMFVWGTTLGPAKHPYGLFFRGVIRPRLQAPEYLEPEAPPRFAQGVGLLVSGVGLSLHLVGVPYGLVVAAMAAFIAAFLNAVFGLCLGCELYAVLLRLGVVGKKKPARASADPVTREVAE